MSNVRRLVTSSLLVMAGGMLSWSSAAEQREAPVLSLMVEQADAMQEPTPEIDRLNAQGFSKLHSAAIAGNLEAARQLLEQGADPNVRQGTYRGTPLQYAAARGHLEIVRLLLEHDADVNSSDSNGRTPVMWAATAGQTAVVQALLEAGADRDAATPSGWTAARYALAGSHRESVMLLGASGSDRPPEEMSPFDTVLRIPHGPRTVPCFVVTTREERLEEKLAVLGGRLDAALKIVEQAEDPDVYAFFFLRAGPEAAAGIYTGFSRRELREIVALPVEQRAEKLLHYAWAIGEPELLKHHRLLAQVRNDAGSAPRRSAGTDGIAEGPSVCQVRARIVSTDYRKLDGGIERAIVAAWKLPEHERVALENFEGEHVRIELPPGVYRLDFSAVGTRGATFQGSSREITVTHGQPPLDVGTINLAISRTTALYGRPAPELQGIIAWKNTEPFALEDLRGKVVVLDFFGYYCTICHAHKPDLAKLYEKYRERGLVVLALHDDSLATLAEVNEQMDPILRRVFNGNVPPLPMGLDGPNGKSVFRAYGIHAVPAVILIDQQGRVVRRFHHAGVPELEMEVQRLLNDAQVRAAAQPERQAEPVESEGTTAAEGTPAVVPVDRP